MNKVAIKKFATPILLIGFNRPDVIREAFNFIRASQPSILYVAIDQARENVKGELELVNEVKEIVKNIDWDCQVAYKFNKTNLGAEITVSSAVSWVLEIEETVIVLEDDIIAPKSFLYFAQEMLERYKYSNNVYMVSSNQFTPYKMDTDYTFSTYGHSNGWATWRRAWNKFDLKISVSEKYIEVLRDKNNYYSLAEQTFFENLFERMRSYGVGNSTWDLCWFYIRFINKGLTIVPKVNISCNIGVYGLHATGITKTHFRQYDETFVCEKHPKIVSRNMSYDYYHFKNYLEENPTVVERIFRRIKTILRIDILFFKLRRMSYDTKKRRTLNL